MRDQACNIGHWALPDRHVTVDDRGAVLVDGRRVVVFRFSGFDPDVPDAFTRYNRRVAWHEAGDAHLVFERFRAALVADGLDETRRWPYAYGAFDNGVPVPDLARRLYASLGETATRFGDPLATAGPDSFWRWLTSPAEGLTVPRFWQAVHAARPDLQRAFPDLAGEDAGRFMAWARQSGLAEHQVHDALLAEAARWIDGRPRVAVATALTANFVPYARVMARSLGAVRPEIQVYAVVAERRSAIEGWHEPGLILVPIEDFGLPDLPWQAFVGGPFELTVLGKPLVLRHVLDQGFDTAIFIDADILITGDLSPFFATCAAHAVTLTPHLLHPAATGDRVRRELTMLRSGTFNGGTVAVSGRPEGRRFLEWWLTRVRACNRLEPGAGMHHDQRWLDLAPAFFDEVGIVRDAGCNVAYWNLPERRLRREGGALVVDGGPCRYLHLSGFDPGRPDLLSKHGGGSGRDALGSAADVLDDYVARLDAAGLTQATARPYSFGAFDNGVPIPDIARALLRDLPGSRERFPDPFTTGREDSFLHWLTSPDQRLGADHRVPVLWGEVHRRREDLRRAFPDPAGRDQGAFLAWTASSGLREHGVDARLLPGID